MHLKNRFHQFKDINVVTNVLPKPDKRGFERAMTDFLGLDDPSVVCMIGDNFLTDGGARLAGMHFVHIRPIRGMNLLSTHLQENSHSKLLSFTSLTPSPKYNTNLNNCFWKEYYLVNQEPSK